MCKSSTLAFVLIFAFLFKLEKPTWKLVTIIVIITVGVVLMVANETEFDVVGFMQVMSAAVCGGLRWSLTEVLLRRESMGLTNPFASIFFLAPAQGIILFVISGLVEGYITIFNSAFFISFAEGLNTIAIILAGGSLAFCMIVSEFFLIKRTSVVTLSVCGIFKEVATIFISMLVFGDVLTIVNTIGLCITLFGIGLYNWFKFNIVSARTRKEAAELENERILAIAEDNERNREDDAMKASSVEDVDEDINMVDDVEDEENMSETQEQNSGDSSEEDDEDVNSLNESDLDDEADDLESDEDDEVEEMDVDGLAKKRTNKYDTEAFSSAMTKILSHKLSGSDKKQPILARSKGVERKIEDEKLDYKARKILAAQKKAAKEKGRVIPDFTTFDYEKKLRKVATRGVVKLFNAIRTQQKMTEVAVNNAASTKKTLNAIERAKDVSTMSKSSFLDLLKSGKK
ncbi:Rrp15p-domain-containing protein [Mycotypha africana]|uniref:Rrp15p-domain-containing protein n=1 Tax=Mycotypha africana TaxID=64632 RepID=UPI00230125ED|nr:Rrp15p-domain-containing protein [Mycotypha africana]KAI8984700.1 Rrp15p-domain-containing protein [Mycotypha africana]